MTLAERMAASFFQHHQLDAGLRLHAAECRTRTRVDDDEAVLLLLSRMVSK